MFDIAHKFLRGCGWFALLVGGVSGAAFAWLSQHESGVLDPQISRQIFTHVLLGRMPTVLVAAFVLLRVNFQLATDPGLARRLHDGHLTADYVLACALACVMAWAWFFLSVLAGSWLGMVQALSGYGQVVWESFWTEFEFRYLAHAGARMLMLAASLSALTFFEVRFLQAHEEPSHQMMSRAMTLGMLVIVGIEVADFFLMLH
ncbi:MAG: hypothetical protein ACKOWC_08935 [Limnohabitans sp.]